MIFGVDAYTHICMLLHGFTFHRTSLTRFWSVFPLRPLAWVSRHQSPAKHVTYWHREHKSKHKLPMLFIHGIGVGLFPYTTFFNEINQGSIDNDVGIIAIELMAISSRLTDQAYDQHILVGQIKQILDHHGWTKCLLIGHSYGTSICNHLLKSPQTASYIGPIVLIDPICFLLHLPDVAFNFTMRAPSTAQEYVLWYFASKDIGVAHTLGRRFFWSLNILWREDLEAETQSGYRDVTVVLSERDDIVDVRAVRRYLSRGVLEVNDTRADSLATPLLEDPHVLAPWCGEGLEVLWMEGLHHAQSFDFHNSRKQLVDVVRKYSSKGRTSDEIP